MGMGIVSDKDFDLEKSKLTREESNPESGPISNSKTIIQDIKRGRGHTPNVPDSLRKVIGETSTTEGRQEALELANDFGISPSSVSAYSNGVTSTATYDKPDEGLTNHINSAKDRVSKRARIKLMEALKHITPAKLEGAKARELSAVARDMSAIVKDMEPDTPKVINETGVAGPTFVFYAPQFRDERSYDVVNAKE